MDLSGVNLQRKNELTAKIDSFTAQAGTLQADLAKLQTAQTSWQTRDADFTGLQSQNSNTLGIYQIPCDSYGLRSCQDYLTYYNDTHKSGCSGELDEQTRHLQSLITNKEQQISMVQININFLTHQIKALEGVTP